MLRTSVALCAFVAALSATPAFAGDPIGVAACDDYITKVDACLSSKVPEETRQQYSSALDTMREAWRPMAADPNSKAGLEAACQQATEAAKQAYASYGCEF